jgi:hypothetical protein
MRAESHASETRRKRPTQRSRNFFEHALICDGFAAPLGAHGLCPALLALFHGHLFGSRCLNLTDSTNIISPQRFGSQLRETVAKAAFRPKGRIGAHCFGILHFLGDE